MTSADQPGPIARRLRWCAGVVLLGLVLRAPLAAQVAPEARATVVRFQAGIIEAMRAHASEGPRAREARLGRMLGQSFDLAYIAQVVLAHHWRTLDDARQARLLALFAELVSSTYAAELTPYAGEHFKFELARPLRRGRVLVRTSLVEGHGERQRLDYVLHQRAGARDVGFERVTGARAPDASAPPWRIINVVVDGVSDLALKRAEYGGLMERQGYAALVAHIEARIDAFRRVPRAGALDAEGPPTPACRRSGRCQSRLRRNGANN